jgi:NitT/TauT family transport system substrate-binding protein
MTYLINKEKIQIILISSFIVLLISHSFTSINAQTTPIKKPIKIGLSLWVPYFLAYVAQEKGFFKKNNVDVNLTMFPDYNVALNAYMNGDLDGIFAAYPDVLIPPTGNIKTRVVYGLDNSNSADAIVGKGNNLSDVKGRSIGITGINTFSHYFVLKSLEKVGLTEGDVLFVIIPVQNVTSALQKGQIFAGHLYDPFIDEAIKRGFKILSTPGNVTGLIQDVLSFNSDIVQQRPQDIQNIVKSMIEAKADYDKNTFNDIAIMSLKSGLSKDKIIEGIKHVKLLDLNYNNQILMNKSLNKSTSLYVSGNGIAKFYAERGMISEYPSIGDLAYPQFVIALLKENNMTKP